jgi:hypothetical protein
MRGGTGQGDGQSRNTRHQQPVRHQPSKEPTPTLPADRFEKDARKPYITEDEDGTKGGPRYDPPSKPE